MNKVSNKQRYFSMFNEYTHNIPVIFSSLEGQYDGELFVDSEIDTQIAVMFTPFSFHYVAGNPELENIVDILDKLIFKQYLAISGQKEAIVFCPNEKWDKVLDELFARHRGIKSGRKIFHLNRDEFNQIQSNNAIQEGIINKLFYEQANGSQIKYPVSRIFNGEDSVSFCSGFMLGNGHAEIDVATEEAYRGKGYAKMASITLINELLANGIEPDWCTFPYRVESEKLALSLGFELYKIVPVHIWVEKECGKIEN